MARKSKSMGPIIDAAHESINKAIYRLALRQYRHIKLPFTFDDIKQLFVSPVWRDKLTEVFTHAAPGGVSYDFHAGVADQRVGNGDRLRPVTVHFNWRSGSEGAFLPLRGIATSLHPVLTVENDCPSELQEKWEHMMHELCTVAHDFGECRWVLKKLNQLHVCKSAAAIRYVWPCLVPLLEMADCPSLANEVREPRPRSSWSSKVPFAVQEKLSDTNDFLARAMLVEDPGNVKYPVDYSMNEVAFGQFTGVIDTP